MKITDVSCVQSLRFSNIIIIDCNHEDIYKNEFRHEIFVLSKNNEQIAHFESNHSIRVADLEKVSVTDIEGIPYWEYENSQLVQSIPISKKSVKNLLTLLEQVEDDKKEFRLIYSSSKLNKFLILERGTEKFYLYRQRPISTLFLRKPK